ncbi:putative histone acetyltransferase type b catalytic subunit [Stachybotrys elegans]|uniref:Histone acetyltransferase type B catalytic subunit n=1 Tax=Stachybotrys elegans TaxID=80388 RepID=A0A8K0T1P2_9HYPO|nr:putative histone acetyltransferase type b catalytic subunit [Stachybotrys elegans]
MAQIADVEEWMTSSNDALSITLVAPSASGLRPIGTFHPKFTYSIFGEEEKIFGYKDLKVNLRYRSNDMRPHLKVSQSKKFKPMGDLEPTDIVGLLKEGEHLPKVAFVKESDFEDSSKQMSDSWTPPGTLHTTINAPDAQYEIWRGSLTDPAVRQLNTRAQFLVPLFIEGGSYIGQDQEAETPEINITDAEAERWTIFFMYKKQPLAEDPEKHSYVFVGYSTIYRFFYFRPTTPPPTPKDDWELPAGDFDLAELPCRTRLSQFIILPPFQGKGNGARLYKTIFEYYHKHSQTSEFTVEDPNEAFDDLRDACDLAFLRSMPEFQALRIDTSVTIPKSGPVPRLILGCDDLEALRLKAKIAPRQFARVLEMHLMSQLPDSVRASMSIEDDVPAPTKADKHHERLWQLLVKQRLYRHNKDLLAQIAQPERIEKLQETLGSVELEYARLLAAHDRANKHSEAESLGATTTGKRKLEGHAEEGLVKRVKTATSENE